MESNLLVSLGVNFLVYIIEQCTVSQEQQQWDRSLLREAVVPCQHVQGRAQGLKSLETSVVVYKLVSALVCKGMTAKPLSLYIGTCFILKIACKTLMFLLFGYIIWESISNVTDFYCFVIGAVF